MYKSEITYSSRELTGREKLIVKDVSNATSLNDVAGDPNFAIKPEMWAKIHVTNDEPKEDTNAEYDRYVIIDDAGQKYVTGSESFWQSFIEIVEAMEDEAEDYKITAFKVKSRNNEGSFLKASIV